MSSGDSGRNEIPNASGVPHRDDGFEKGIVATGNNHEQSGQETTWAASEKRQGDEAMGRLPLWIDDDVSRGAAEEEREESKRKRQAGSCGGSQPTWAVSRAAASWKGPLRNFWC